MTSISSHHNCVIIAEPSSLDDNHLDILTNPSSLGHYQAIITHAPFLARATNTTSYYTMGASCGGPRAAWCQLLVQDLVLICKPTRILDVFSSTVGGVPCAKSDGEYICRKHHVFLCAWYYLQCFGGHLFENGLARYEIQPLRCPAASSVLDLFDTHGLRISIHQGNPLGLPLRACL